MTVSALGDRTTLRCSISVRDLLARHPLPLVPLILVRPAGSPETGMGIGSTVGVHCLDHMNGGQHDGGDGADQQQNQTPSHVRLDQPGVLPGSLVDVCHGDEHHDQVDQPQNRRGDHRPEHPFHGGQEPRQTRQDHDGDAEQESHHAETPPHFRLQTSRSNLGPENLGRQPRADRTDERQHTCPHRQDREQRKTGSRRLEAFRNPIDRTLESGHLLLAPPALGLARAVSRRRRLIWRLRGHPGPFVTSFVRDHSAPFTSSRQPHPWNHLFNGTASLRTPTAPVSFSETPSFDGAWCHRFSGLVRLQVEQLSDAHAPGINDETDLLGFPTPALRGRSVPRGHRPLFLPHGWPDARRPGFRLGVGRFAASQ